MAAAPVTNMRISDLTVYVAQLPLKRAIKHASHSRHESENLFVRCRLADGTEGWGEGVPREYVTGETPNGAIEQLRATPLAEQLDRPCRSWREVFDLCERFQPTVEGEDPRGCRSNALRCAVELSILDAFGKLFGEPLKQATRAFDPAREIQASNDRVQYSAAIMSEGSRGERISALKMRIYGFSQCKVKVGIEGADDDERLRRIRWWLGGRFDIRVDANEAWDIRQACQTIESLQKHQISCVEQPLPHAAVEGHAEIRRKIDCPIMLDESLTSLFDAEMAIRDETCDLFNIRLSKCGGYLNSLRLAALAHQNKLGYQLGCHPGESGILSAAGRHWAGSVRNICYLEGSYDRHLLSELPTHEDITFRYGGWAQSLAEPGLGVTMNPSVLKRMTTCEETFRLD